MRFLTRLWQQMATERAAQRRQQRVRRFPNRPASHFRPRLEVLEDRCVPSTLTVTSTSDDVNMKGTLRYDIAHAANGDTIRITPALHGAPIVLTHGELLVDKDLTIEANPNHTATISGNNNSRVFEVASGAHVTLKNLVLTEGNGVADNPSGTSSFNGDGGGALNFGTLTIKNSTLSGNSANGDGGGIFNRGTLAVSNSTLSGNSTVKFGGGGIFNGESSMLTVENSTLSGNSAGSDGGGIYNYHGTLMVSNSTLSGNSTVKFGGGGIFNGESSTLTVDNSILYGNSASSDGGGIYGLGTVTVSKSILFNNSSTFGGGGIFDGEASTLTVENSILSGNSAGSDGGGIFDYLGTLTVRNSFLSGNSADNDGGGIYNFGGTVTVSSSILFGNSAQDGGGIYNLGTLMVGHSSFYDNTPDAIFGPYTDEGGNTFF